MFFTEKWQQAVEALQQNVEQLQQNSEKLQMENEAKNAELAKKDASIAALLEVVNAQNERLLRIEENVRNINSAVAGGSFADMESIRLNLRNNNDLVEQCLRQTKEYRDSVNRITFEAAKSEAGSEKENDNSNAYGTIDYFDFEDHFRGSREMIKNNQKSYVKFFEGCQNVVDIGCGRGEFLELMKENGIGAVGVDTYKEFVDYCKERDLDVVEQDAIEYLLNCDGTDGIFAGQLVEHLKIGQIIALCRIAYDKLKPGKSLIMETPNPMSLAIYTHAFYLDPSHMKPVHPLLLEYVARKAGFTKVEIIYTKESRLDSQIPALEIKGADLTEYNKAMAEVSELLFGSQDYAIVATK